MAALVVASLLITPAGLSAQDNATENSQPTDVVSGLRHCLSKLNDVADWLATDASRDCPAPESDTVTPPDAPTASEVERTRLQARIKQLETQLQQRDTHIDTLEQTTRDLAQRPEQDANLSADIEVMLKELIQPYAQGRCDRLSVASSRVPGTVQIKGQVAQALELQDRLRDLSQQLAAVRLDAELESQTLCGASLGEAWLLLHDAEGRVQRLRRDQLTAETRGRLVASSQCVTVGEALESAGVLGVAESSEAGRFVFWVKDAKTI
jgi:hypothetical protein